jgi:acylphosphatase
MQIRCAHIFVSGRVQGVFYRAYTCEQAVRLGLTGWVRNLPDGRVEIIAEGPRDRIEQLIKWCHQGPPLARVTEVKTSWEQATGQYDRFDVRYR